MCLAAPVKVLEINPEGQALVDKEGVTFTVSSKLFPALSVGDYVLVHAGFVIQKIEEDDALERIDMIADLYRSDEA